MPDYGARNPDALNDDLRELREPLTERWMHSPSMKTGRNWRLRASPAARRSFRACLHS